MVVDKSEYEMGCFILLYHFYSLATSTREIENCFIDFTERDDIAIILITQYVADKIRAKIDSHISNSLKPVVLEIPSKDYPYDENKDGIMRRVRMNPVRLELVF